MLEKVEKLLTEEATDFLDDLAREFRDELDDLLFQRKAVQEFFDEGYSPGFLSQDSVEGDWKIFSSS